MPMVAGSSGIALHYEDTGGGGRPVVLIHGWPLSGAFWGVTVGALAGAGHRVVTYDRRGFGESDKPARGYGYDQLADDLAALLHTLDLREVTLVGFAMGGGEVARYLSRHGSERVRAAVFAASVTPYLLHGFGNPDGPLTKTEAARTIAQLTTGSDAFYDGFVTRFFSAGGRLWVSEDERRQALAWCRQAGKLAAIEALQSAGLTDFRADLGKVTVPALVVHGDADAIVPFEGSGRRTHEALPGSELVLIGGGPHGLPVSHPADFTAALTGFLTR